MAIKKGQRIPEKIAEGRSRQIKPYRWFYSYRLQELISRILRKK